MAVVPFHPEISKLRRQLLAEEEKSKRLIAPTTAAPEESPGIRRISVEESQDPDFLADLARTLSPDVRVEVVPGRDVIGFPGGFVRPQPISGTAVPETTEAPRSQRFRPQEPQGKPFSSLIRPPLAHPDIPPDTLRAILEAGIVEPPETSRLPLVEAGAVPTAGLQPIVPDLDLLLSRRKAGRSDTRELEVEARRQAEARSAERPSLGGALEAVEHVFAPLDVGIHTIPQGLAQIPKVLRGDIGDVEVPTLFSSGLRLDEGFVNSLNEFHARPGWEQAILQLFDLSIAIPFLGTARKLATVSRFGTRLAKTAPEAFQVERALAAGFPNAPISPPPRSVAPGLTEKMARLQELQEFGLILDSTANEFVAPLRAFADVVADVVISENPIIHTILGRSGINRAIGRNSTVGQSITAYQTQRIAVDEMVNVTLAAAFDSHARRWTGQISHLLPIDKDGFFGSTGKLWQDVFSKPGQYDLRSGTKALIDDYNQVTNFEIPRLLEDAGITQRMRSRPTGEYYVPRDAHEIRGISTNRHSSPGLQRHYDEATDGFDAQVRYDIDPRRTMELHLRWAENKIIRKQLADAIEPLSVTARELVPIGIRDARAGVLREILELEKSHKGIRSMIQTTGSQARVAAVRTGERVSRMVQLQGEVDRLDDLVADLPILQGVATEAVRVELATARKELRASEVLMGTIDTELTRANQNLARISGKSQVTAAELRRLDQQFVRLGNLEDKLASVPLRRLGAASSEAGLAERSVERAQARFLTLEDARTQIRQTVDQLKDDVLAARQITSEARTRLRGATSQAIVREGQRGRIQGTGALLRQQQAGATARLTTRGQRVATAGAMEFEIQIRRSILAGHLDHVEQQIIKAKARRTTLNAEYKKAFEEAEQAGIAPGGLFGPNQPNEIGIDVWRSSIFPKGRFFPRADVDLLKGQLDRIGVETFTSKSIKALEILGNSVRFLAAVGDFAMPFIQGLPVLATDPDAWTRMSLRHYQAFFDPRVQSRLIRDNITDFQWLARHGVSVGDPEFFRALEIGQGFSPGRLLELLPKGEEARRLARLGGKQSFGRFQASYNTGLGWSRALLLKSLRDGWKGTDSELARYIRNLTGGLDSRALGIGPGQRSAEGMLLAFSPRLLRSTSALFVDAFKPGTVVGRASLRSLAQLATGATSLFVLTGLALGKDWDEIKIGLNPLNGKRYLAHQINGDWVGVGGQVRAISQMMAGALVDPQSLISLDRFENPLIRFLAGRGAPILGIAQATGEAFLDKNLEPYEEIDGIIDLGKHVGTTALPFALQGVLEGEGLTAVLAGLVGARTSPETAFEKRNTGRDSVRARLEATGQLPPSTVGKEFRELDLDYQRIIDRQPEMEPLLKEVAELNTRRQRPIQLLKDDLQVIDDKQDRLIADAAAQLGPGKAFRLQLAVLQRDRSRDKDNKREDDIHREAAQAIEEFEPSEAAFQIALTAYMEALNDPRLENEATGEYDFNLRDEVLDVVKEDHPGMIDRIETFLRDDSELRAISPKAADMVKQLQEDRELLRPYFEIPGDVVDGLPSSAKRAWDIYSANDFSRDEYSSLVSGISAQINSRQTAWIFNHPDTSKVDLALLRQGYGITPHSNEGAAFKNDMINAAIGRRPSQPAPTEPSLPSGVDKEALRKALEALTSGVNKGAPPPGVDKEKLRKALEALTAQ